MRDADVILVLDDGQIVAKGTHEELLATSSLYSEILGTQLRGPTVPVDSNATSRTEVE